MSTNRLFAFSAAAAALALGGAGSALAQDQATAADAGASYSAEIPAEYATHSYATEQTVESTVAPDGTVVETVTRTRRIPARAHHDRSDQPVPMMHHGYQAHHAAYQPVVWDRETWLAECHARTRGVDEKKRGGIIGGLLGAITGGVIGNRAWDSERLAGTIIGAGAGGLIGGLIGSAIDRGDERPYYDCEEALDRYMSGAVTTPRYAARQIPAYGYPPMVAYAPVYAASYGYSQPMTYIESTEEIPQQVIVREYVTEEWIEEAAPRTPAIREIEEYSPPPSKLVPIKPRPSKAVPIKGN